MIMCCRKKLPIGETINVSFTTNILEFVPPQPLFIKREATYEEYVQWCVETNCPYIGTRESRRYYYEVTTD